MISVDTNILLHSFHNGSPHHQKALQFIESNARNSQFAICELVLIEFYCLIRNPAVFEAPLSANDAVVVCQSYRRNKYWQVIDYPGGLMGGIWQQASSKQYPRRKIFDDRLSATLLYYGVKEFATNNIKDFKNAGFKKVWNPLRQA